MFTRKSAKSAWLVVLTLFCGFWMIPPPAGFGPAGGLATPPESIDTFPWRLTEASGKIEPALLREMLRQQDAPIRYIVYLAAQADLKPPLAEQNTLARRQAVVATLRETAAQTQWHVLSTLEQEKAAGRVESYRPFWVCNAAAVVGRLESALAVAALPEVQIVRRDRQHRLEYQPPADSEPAGDSDIPWNITRVGADLAWNRLGINGSSVVVAIMDSGADAQHPALHTRYRGYNPKGLPTHGGNWFCATDEGYLYPGDGLGHGTHVLGTIVGLNGIGMAPGAQWIAVKAFNNDGYTYDSWLHAGFQWLLAPEGDPNLAPDLVNNSWGSELSNDETFRPDVQALRAANILTVFSAGNEGPGAGSVSSPASLPEALAVGATDAEDAVTTFSGRGPSPWHEIKPEVVAPGVDVLSSVPGGGYALMDGTSMAAPHVAGTAALLLQANPALTPFQIERAITTTAILSGGLPNNIVGWGRLDAYGALLSVTKVGTLQGTVVRARDRAPLPGATVTARSLDGGRETRTQTDAGGRYELALAPGWYAASASRFGYAASTVQRIEVKASATTQCNFALTLLPVGAVVGRITEKETGSPLAATVSASDVISTTTDPATGLYSLALPAGSYTVRAVSPGHRIGRADNVRVTVGSITSLDLALPRAPSILLVDSGAWYYNSQIAYYKQALDDLGYLYDTWTIRDVKRDLPPVSTLASYDVVIWSAPEDAPGFIGAAGAVTKYLDGGGRLFLSGQDVAFWDGGGSIFTYSPYFTLYLKALYVRDDAGRTDLVGEAGDIYVGLRWELNGADSARNQDYPDEVAPWDAEHAVPIARFAEDGCAGLRIGACLPYRVVYLAAGFEGLGQRASRALLMQRTLDWLLAPRPAAGLELTASRQPALPLDGQVITHTLRLRNTGALTDTYRLQIEQARWPTTFWDASFQNRLTETVRIGSCRSISVGVQVEIPVGTGWNIPDHALITARSSNDPRLTRQVTLTSKTPAPILLVDDDRWYHMESYYEDALRANGLPYDRWEVGWNVGDARGSPPLSVLRSHPIVLWFTGCDWANPLSQQEEERLAQYLEGGGRLFLSGQDYLFAHGLTDFAVDYLGVLTYTEDLTTTLIYGAENSPIVPSQEPYALEYPYENWSDALMPTEEAKVAFFGSHHHPCALTWTPPGAKPVPKTVFFAFPFESLKPLAARRILGEIAFWLSQLGDSILAVDKAVAAEGEVLTYTLGLHNTGITTTVWLSNTLPTELSYLAGTLSGGAQYDAARRTIRWQGRLAAGEAITFTYRARLATRLPEGTAVINPVVFRTELGLDFKREILTRVNAPDLSLSTKRADAPASLGPGDHLTYTITLRNLGVRAANARFEDRLPEEMRCLTETAQASSGVITATQQAIAWRGQIGVGESITVTYQVVLDAERGGLRLVNEVAIYDGTGETLWRRCRVGVPAYVYLPRLLKADY